jgi:hypothetical protein
MESKNTPRYKVDSQVSNNAFFIQHYADLADQIKVLQQAFAPEQGENNRFRAEVCALFRRGL